MTHLDEITINGYRSSMLPPEMGNLNELTCLRIKELPKEIGRMTNLEVLAVDTSPGTSPLSSLPDEPYSLQNLEALSLEGSNIESAPEDIGRLKNLAHLSLLKTPIQFIPDNIKELESLEIVTDFD